MIPAGRAFFKMSGSGNDFVMVDCRREPVAALAEAETVSRICARGTGVGADGIVFLEPSSSAVVRLIYLNADGSRADLCGNATLCTTRLAVELGFANASGFAIETDSGLVEARIAADGRPEIDLQPVTDVELDSATIGREPGEERIGFATVGVPHVVVRCANVLEVDVAGRGKPIRNHSSLRSGANANFVSPGPDGSWLIRTYERGVEAETLACGSGSVASAILLSAWREAKDGTSVDLRSRSGKMLRARLRRSDRGWHPSLSGEAAIVYRGELSEV